MGCTEGRPCPPDESMIRDDVFFRPGNRWVEQSYDGRMVREANQNWCCHIYGRKWTQPNDIAKREAAILAAIRDPHLVYRQERAAGHHPHGVRYEVCDPHHGDIVRVVVAHPPRGRQRYVITAYNIVRGPRGRPGPEVLRDLRKEKLPCLSSGTMRQLATLLVQAQEAELRKARLAELLRSGWGRAIGECRRAGRTGREAELLVVSVVKQLCEEEKTWAEWDSLRERDQPHFFLELVRRACDPG